MCVNLQYMLQNIFTWQVFKCLVNQLWHIYSITAVRNSYKAVNWKLIIDALLLTRKTLSM